MTCPDGIDCAASEMASTIFTADLGLSLALLAFIVAAFASKSSSPPNLVRWGVLVWTICTLFTFSVLPAYQWDKGSDAVTVLVISVVITALLTGTIAFAAVDSFAGKKDPWSLAIWVPMILVVAAALFVFIVIPGEKGIANIGRISAIFLGVGALLVLIPQGIKQYRLP